MLFTSLSTNKDEMRKKKTAHTHTHTPHRGSLLESSSVEVLVPQLIKKEGCFCAVGILAFELAGSLGSQRGAASWRRGNAENSF